MENIDIVCATDRGFSVICTLCTTQIQLPSTRKDKRRLESFLNLGDIRELKGSTVSLIGGGESGAFIHSDAAYEAYELLCNIIADGALVGVPVKLREQGRYSGLPRNGMTGR